MPYILQTVCRHENCDCQATLHDKNGRVTFLLKREALNYARGLQEETETDIEVLYYYEGSSN